MMTVRGNATINTWSNFKSFHESTTCHLDESIHIVHIQSIYIDFQSAQNHHRDSSAAPGRCLPQASEQKLKSVIKPKDFFPSFLSKANTGIVVPLISAKTANLVCTNAVLS